MASQSFSSLKDILKCQSPQNPSFKLQSSSASLLQTKSEELNKASHAIDMSSNLSLSFLGDLSPTTEMKKLDEDAMKSQTNSGKNHENEAGDVKHPISSKWPAGFKRPSFPPPLSCFRLFKTGKPYQYLKFNEDDDSFVFEEMKIPDRILLASRHDGRLKLFFACSAEVCGNGEGEESEGENAYEEGKEKEEMNHGKVEGNI